MTASPTLRRDRRTNRAELVAQVIDAAGPDRPVLVVVPRAAAAQSWSGELLRRAPELSGFLRVIPSTALARLDQRTLLEAALVVAENLDEFGLDALTIVEAATESRVAAGRPVLSSRAAVDSETSTLGCSTIRVHHRAVEADAAVSVLHRWIDEGRDPDRLTIALPQRDPVLIAELVAAARRLGLPVRAGSGRLGDHPIVTELAAALPVDQPRGVVLDVAFRWWRDHASALFADRPSVDLVSTFIRALSTGSSMNDALGHRVQASHARGVSIVALNDALDPPSDRPWSGVVLVGCVDGTFPRRRLRHAPAAERTAEAFDALLADDQRRLDLLRNVIDPTGNLIAVSAPVGGVLPSPFLDGWRRQDLVLVRVASIAPPRPNTTTSGGTPIFPTGRLRLSATQLTTFEDCSWRYAFEYGIGLRGVGGASATAGTLVHGVLERFLDPSGPEPAPERSVERLLEILDHEWDHSQFPYTAQGLDYRRRAEQWLRNWFEVFAAEAPDVRLTEHRFEVPFPPDTNDGDAHHVLVGSIDRVDVVPSLGGSGVRIVDYKSGSPKSPREVDDDLQLAIYHYAALHDPAVHDLGDPTALELHYLQDDASKERLKVLGRAVTPSLEAETTARVSALADEILAEHYDPNTDATCEYCGFHALCPVQLQGRRVP